MNLEQYIPLAVRTEKPLPQLKRLEHSCMGLITEMGEVVTELKRMEIYGKPLDTERKAHIIEEIGDVMWYVAIFLHTMEVPLHMVQSTANQPYPEGDTQLYGALSLMLGQHTGILCGMVNHMFIENTMYSVPPLQLLESLRLIMVGMRVLAERCDSSLEQAMADNIAKLQVRFPDAFSEVAAEARADKGGLDARSS